MRSAGEGWLTRIGTIRTDRREYPCGQSNKVRLQTIDQEKVATDVHIAAIAPLAGERVIEPFGAEWLVGDKDHPRLLEPGHIVAAGAGQPVPVLAELTFEIKAAGKPDPFGARRSFRGRRTALVCWRNFPARAFGLLRSLGASLRLEPQGVGARPARSRSSSRRDVPPPIFSRVATDSRLRLRSTRIWSISDRRRFASEWALRRCAMAVGRGRKLSSLSKRA